MKKVHAGADLSHLRPIHGLNGRGSAQHQHRNVRMRQHLLGFAAQQQTFDAFATV